MELEVDPELLAELAGGSDSDGQSRKRRRDDGHGKERKRFRGGDDGGEGPMVGRSAAELARREQQRQADRRRQLAALLQQPVLPQGTSSRYLTANQTATPPTPLGAQPASHTAALEVAHQPKRKLRGPK